MVVYGATRQILVAQERNTVKDTVNAVVQRLSPVRSNLTVADVVPRIDVSSAQDKDDPAAGAMPTETSHSSLFRIPFSRSCRVKISRFLCMIARGPMSLRRTTRVLT